LKRNYKLVLIAVPLSAQMPFAGTQKPTLQQRHNRCNRGYFADTLPHTFIDPLIIMA